MSSARQLELSLKSIQLVDPGQKVIGPDGVVYSTNPKTAVGLDELTYFLKGPEIEIVAAEAFAHLLARLVDLPVPDFGLARIDDDTYFASLEAQIRNVGHFLANGKITNPQTLQETIVFDVWVANTDRNLGNFVGQVTPNPNHVRILPIDFEKSASIRERTPIVQIPMIPVRDFWPSEDLGRIASGSRLPEDFCGRIAAVTSNQITHCAGVVAAHLPQYEWGDSTVRVLKTRASQIVRLCREVWR